MASKKPITRSLAYQRGHADYWARQFVNPYQVPLLRKRWLQGFSAAAQSHRNAARFLATQDARNASFN